MSALSLTSHTSSPSSKTFRLTRRGRLLLVGIPVLTLLIVAVFSLGVAVTAAAASPESSPAVTTVTVTQGESLWAVAERVNPHADTREVVDAILQLNGLSSDTVIAGQQVDVPVFSK